MSGSLSRCWLGLGVLLPYAGSRLTPFLSLFASRTLLGTKPHLPDEPPSFLQFRINLQVSLFKYLCPKLRPDIGPHCRFILDENRQGDHQCRARKLLPGLFV